MSKYTETEWISFGVKASKPPRKILRIKKDAEKQTRRKAQSSLDTKQNSLDWP